MTTKAMEKAMELVADRQERFNTVSLGRIRADRQQQERRLREVTELLGDVDDDLEAWTALDDERRALRAEIAQAGRKLSEGGEAEAFHRRAMRQARDELSAVVRAEYESGSRKSFERIAGLVREALAELDSADELRAELSREAGVGLPLDALAATLRRELIGVGPIADWKVTAPNGEASGFVSPTLWEDRRRAA